MKQRQNYYQDFMCDNYEELKSLLDRGFVVVCFIDYEYRTGGKTMVFRDVAKVKSNDYGQNSPNYGYIVEARGIVYLNWDRRMDTLRGITFEGLCEQYNLQYIKPC